MADEESKTTGPTAGKPAAKKKAVSKKKAVTKNKAVTKKKSVTKKKAATKKKATTKKKAVEKKLGGRKLTTEAPAPVAASSSAKEDAAQASKQKKVSEKLKDMGVSRDANTPPPAATAASSTGSSSNINFEFILIAMVIIFMVVFLAVFGDGTADKVASGEDAQPQVSAESASSEPATAEEPVVSAGSDADTSAALPAAAAVQPSGEVSIGNAEDSSASAAETSASGGTQAGDVSASSEGTTTASDDAVTQSSVAKEVPVVQGATTTSTEWPSAETATGSVDAASSSTGDANAEASARMRMGGSANTRGSSYGRGYGDNRYGRSPGYYPPVTPAPPEGMQNPPQGYYPPYYRDRRQGSGMNWSW